MANVPDTPLPTLERLGITSLPPISPQEALCIAQEWLSKFTAASSAKSIDVDKVLAILHPTESFWRDMLALTWDLRTFAGPSKTAAFLTSRLAESDLHDVTLNSTYTAFQQPYEDLAWVSMLFDFKTKVGTGTGIVRLVPFPKVNTTGGSLDELEWKAHTVYTNLESLNGHTEKIGPNRNFEPNHGKWESQRQEEASFVGAEEDAIKGPRVLVIGAGQSGLDIAARLKALDVPALVVEKNERVGDNWRHRYEALCLHDPVCKLPSCPFCLYTHHLYRVRPYALSPISAHLACLCTISEGSSSTSPGPAPVSH